MNMYFLFNSNIIPVFGNNQACVYDIFNKRILLFSNEKFYIIKKLYAGMSFKEISKNLNISKKEISDFVEELVDQKIGYIYKNHINYQAKKVQTPQAIKKNSYFKESPLLTKLFIEVNNECDFNCYFCGGKNIKRSMGCFGCNIWNNENNNIIGKSKLINIINHAKIMGFKQIILTGGNLFFVWNMLNEALNCLDYFNLYLILNIKSFTLFNSALLAKKLNLLKTNYIINVHYQDIQKISYYKNILKQLEKRLTLGFIVDLDAINQQIKEFNNIIKKTNLNTTNTYFEVVDKNGFEKLTNVQERFITESKRINPDIFQYYFLKNDNPCLSGVLTINSSLDVYVCRMMRNNSFGNLKREKLYNIVGKPSVQELWELTKDKIEPCNDCVLRYGCQDCRALEYALTDELYKTGICRRD